MNQTPVQLMDRSEPSGARLHPGGPRRGSVLLLYAGVRNA